MNQKNQVDILNALNRLGFQLHHIGTTLLCDAINLICQDNNKILKYQNSLYPILAKKYDTKINNVERNIRNSIREAYHNNKEIFRNVLGVELGQECPPNKVFITFFRNYILYK